MATANQGFAVGQLGSLDGEILLYREVVKRFGDRPAYEIVEHVARALVHQGVARFQRSATLMRTPCSARRSGQRCGAARVAGMCVDGATVPAW